MAITNSVDATPLAVGIGGNGSSPTISFTPSIISTVPQTVSGGVGILSGASNPAVDGGDGLYMADTNNRVARYLNPEGVLQTLLEYGSPIGVVVDAYDTVYVSAENPSFLEGDSIVGDRTVYGSGSTVCAVGTTCPFGETVIDAPEAFAVDTNGTVFLSVSRQAYELVPTTLAPYLNFTPLNDFFELTATGAYSGPIAVDSNDAIYAYAYESMNGAGDHCFLTATSYYDSTIPTYAGAKIVAGGLGCGFGGDGGQARGALIGNSIGQMVFDVAGNLYFSDTQNQRVRRIDASTGIITTIAGNGATGYYGDGGPATTAALNNPTGVAVESQGQVYVFSSSSTTGTAQVVRKVGTVGALNLGNAPVGSPTTAQTVTVANTGNSNLDFTHVGFSSGNTTDFAMDVNTTSCNFTVPLVAGKSCKIGLIFTPSAPGSRSAVLSITDDTVTGLNTIQLSGTGYTTATLTPASFTFASTTVGSSTASQTATLTNTGKAAMAISSIGLTGTNITSFSDTTNCGTTLAVGASCTIAMTFKPVAAGALSAALNVNDNALGGHQSASLTGTGIGVAKASLSATSLTFSSTTVGSTSAAQTIKLSNTGSGTLGITSVSMTGADPADFPLTNGCGTSVAAGASCTLTVSFKPAETGTRTASVSVATSTGTITATVTGAAAAKTAKAAKVTLSTQEVSGDGSWPVVLNARVVGASSSLLHGNVQVWEGSHLWAERKLAAGEAIFRITRLPVGDHLMHAVFVDEATDLVSRSPAVEVVVDSRAASPLGAVENAAK